MSGGDLRGLGYPQPGGGLYFCLELGERALPEAVPLLDVIDCDSLRLAVEPASVVGQPFTMTWSDIVGAVST